MKLIKNIIFIIVISAILCILASALSADNFIDVKKEDWFYEYVAKLVNDGVINGTSEITFAPQDNFSIAECSAVITRYLGLESKAKYYSKQMQSAQTPGCDNWFSGYMQVMHETGIMDAVEYGLELIDGYVAIHDASVFATPITRMDFAYLISKSFEISGSLLSQNAPFGIGGYGYEFISTGCYDDTIYNYAGLINDYNSIPQGYVEPVLKMYYNGIFAGDDNGNFNPHANLTRAEMAKVICVITNFDMRSTTDFRALPPQCILNENSFNASVTGEKQLTQTAAFDILSVIANSSITYDTNVLTYSQANITPRGYTCDAYIHTNNETFIVGLSKYGSNYSTYSQSVNIKNTSFEVILILRNLAQDLRIEGVVSAKAGPNGTLQILNAIK